MSSSGTESPKGKRERERSEESSSGSQSPKRIRIEGSPRSKSRSRDKRITPNEDRLISLDIRDLRDEVQQIIANNPEIRNDIITRTINILAKEPTPENVDKIRVISSIIDEYVKKQNTSAYADVGRVSKMDKAHTRVLETQIDSLKIHVAEVLNRLRPAAVTVEPPEETIVIRNTPEDQKVINYVVYGIGLTKEYVAPLHTPLSAVADDFNRILGTTWNPSSPFESLQDIYNTSTNSTDFSLKSIKYKSYINSVTASSIKKVEILIKGAVGRDAVSIFARAIASRNRELVDRVTSPRIRGIIGDILRFQDPVPTTEVKDEMLVVIIDFFASYSPTSDVGRSVMEVILSTHEVTSQIMEEASLVLLCKIIIYGLICYSFYSQLDVFIISTTPLSKESFSAAYNEVLANNRIINNTRDHSITIPKSVYVDYIIPNLLRKVKEVNGRSYGGKSHKKHKRKSHKRKSHKKPKRKTHKRKSRR